MRTIWIDEPGALGEFCEAIEDELIAVDTESDHFHSYQASVCLIQVAAGDVAALIDPIAIEAEEMTPLLDVLEGPGVMKLLHSARNDIMELDRDYGLEIKNIYDTQIAALFLSYERSSLAYLLEELLGVAPGAKFQRFDWTTRPLPAGAAHYATEDVVHLEALKNIFDAELEEAGWTRAFAEQCAHIARTSNHEAKAFDPEGWRKIKTKKTLGPKDRAALAALFAWRHQICLEVNQAALFVMDNASLVRIACARPTTPREFAALSIRKSLNRHRLDSLLETVKRSLEATPPPERMRRSSSSERMSPDAAARLEALKNWRNKAADACSLPRELVASNGTLGDIALRPPKSVEDLKVIGDILPWHRDMFGAEIVEVCRKR